MLKAVRMSATVHYRTGDPALRLLALDILTTQQAQIGIMSGWLDLWRKDQTAPVPAMAWMGMSTAGLCQACRRLLVVATST